jgi:hypothetical protein
MHLMDPSVRYCWTEYKLKYNYDVTALSHCDCKAELLNTGKLRRSCTDIRKTGMFRMHSN